MAAPVSRAAAQAPAAQAAHVEPLDIPHEGGQAQQYAQNDRAPPDGIEAADPHIYLTLDTNLDALLKLRTELNSRAPKSAA